MTFDVSALKHFIQATEAAQFVADEVVKSCVEAVAQRGEFHWVLAGGGTPKLCYQLLREKDLPWQHVHVWFGDERAFEQGHAERNETMAREALLNVVGIPESHIHSIDFKDGTDAAAIAYAQALSHVETFDIVMLGMGEDGHTASLFPNHETLTSQALAVAEFDSPKPPAERVSMGFKALNNHRACFILATGSSKQEVLQHITQGADLPITHIKDAVWVVDHAAWAK